MQGYFVQFLAYTLAMVGFIAVCLLTYKKLCGNVISTADKGSLSIENVLRINARKQIYILKAGNERFLIASDAERTTMLAKLDEEQEENQSIAIKKSAGKKHLGNVIHSVAELNETSPFLKRITAKMKA